MGDKIMSMTRHDYDLIAETLRNNLVGLYDTDTGIARQLAKELAETLEANNDNFDRVVFLAKAGIEL